MAPRSWTSARHIAHAHVQREMRGAEDGVFDGKEIVVS
jgi:hypothetical protein